MAVVADQTIAQAAFAGGFPRDRVAMAVAVALAESGGNATATNTTNTNGTTDYGLWQINSIHRADLAGGDWRDPAANARMAYAVYRRANNSFSPWYAWRNGRHLPFMPRGQRAAIEAEASGGNASYIRDNNPLVPDAIEGPSTALTELADSTARAIRLLSAREFWSRAGMIAIGVVILLAATYALLRSMGGPSVATIAKKGLSK